MELKTFAYPKVNIGLYIGKKREDGFHNISSIFQIVRNFRDVINIDYREDSNNLVRVLGVDVDLEENTVYRAVCLWLEKTGRKACVQIEIEKNIPMKAGLGGGSSDAAAVLLALEKNVPNEFGGKKLGFEELVKTALAVGSDVPFFIYECSAAYVCGRGETVHPIQAKELKFELFDTGFEKLSTAFAYGELDKLGCCQRLPSEQELLLMYNEDTKNWKFENSFEKLYPPLQDGVFLTGSGSWCFRLTK